ncbi:hypothetical protein G6F58_013286 [Rhizopus delemar]|nr:hypothetical protein G6F58_013286 [Rhizopus delemar]
MSRAGYLRQAVAEAFPGARMVYGEPSLGVNPAAPSTGHAGACLPCSPARPAGLATMPSWLVHGPRTTGAAIETRFGHPPGPRGLTT